MNQKIKAMLFGAALLAGCSRYFVSVKDARELVRDPENLVVDCSKNIAPYIEVAQDKVRLDKIITVEIYDYDSRVEQWGWDFEKNYYFAIDQCGAKTVYDNGKITNTYPQK